MVISSVPVLMLGKSKDVIASSQILDKFLQALFPTCRAGDNKKLKSPNFFPDRHDFSVLEDWSTHLCRIQRACSYKNLYPFISQVALLKREKLVQIVSNQNESSAATAKNSHQACIESIIVYHNMQRLSKVACI